MAAPQTHFVITGLVQIFLTQVLKIKFTFWEWITFWIWGVGVDADHFTSWSYVKDIFTGRFPRLFKGGDFGGPSPKVKRPLEIFHIWIVIPIMFVYLVLFNYVTRVSIALWLILLPWSLHLLIDRCQKNNETLLYTSFIYPLGGGWIRRWGYPIKSRVEMIISTILSVPLFVFELIIFWKYIS